MTYADWIAEFDAVTPARREAWQNSIAQSPRRPLFSVLIPVYNPDLRFLDEAITSVEKQIYDNWEICLADDASTDPRVLSFLKLRARHERRIKLFFRETNGHISACSNSALTLARGEWCALLDQDDALAEDALAEVAAEIGRHPEAGIVYSDEDFIDSLGTRSNPFFKPDWNPELFMGQNYLNHLGVYRTALLREIGGFREGFEGSQDYDLVLRCVARLRPDQIRHLPRLLYRWRMVQGSLAEQPDAKPYARHAARDALNSYLQEQGIAARAEPCPQNAESHRVIYEIPSPLPTITVITSSRNTAWLRNDTESVKLEIISANPDARNANEAAKRAQGDVLLFLHGEVQLAEQGWLREMLSHVVRAGVGVVGSALWSPAGTLEDGGLILGVGGIAAPAFRGVPRGHPGYFNRAWLQQNYSAVSGACLMVRKDVFQNLNGFDEANLPQHFFDIDFCLRAQEDGLQVVWTPYANLAFAGSGVREESQSPAEAEYLKQRWHSQIVGDPCYNPNLTLVTPDFALAVPPRPNDARAQP